MTSHLIAPPFIIPICVLPYKKDILSNEYSKMSCPQGYIHRNEERQQQCFLVCTLQTDLSQALSG